MGFSRPVRLMLQILKDRRTVRFATDDMLVDVVPGYILMPTDLRFDPNETPLFTDLYELTMAASYFEIGFNDPACFTMSSRRLPARRGFLVAAGLERLLE